jgi:hypothetical protein
MSTLPETILLIKRKVQLAKKKYKNVYINSEKRDIIHGYIMSDGFVNSEGALTIKQGAKQEKYVHWLKEKLNCLTTPTSQIKPVFEPRTTPKKLRSFRFNTRRLLRGFHKMWYKEYPFTDGTVRYKKVLPRNMKGFFSPVFIAVWYAGDGTKIVGSKGAKFEVTCFTPDERKRLKDIFKTKYNIDAVVNRAGQSSRGEDQWTLNINAKDYPKFHALITKIDLIPTLFPYKLHSVR